MSSPIWTPAALSSEARPYRGQVWRLVEAQHVVSTLALTDTLEEQTVLETLIEQTKPLIPAECRHLHYLLATPFRYGAAYPKGSRFRRAGRTPGVFYASENDETAIAEMAFYRLLFFAESPLTPWPQSVVEFTGFSVAIATGQGLDLTAPALNRDEAAWVALSDYFACQNLADAAREAGIATIRSRSVRDPNGGCNLAVLHCGAFAEPAPIERRSWRLRLGPAGVQAICEFPLKRMELAWDVFKADERVR